MHWISKWLISALFAISLLDRDDGFSERYDVTSFRLTVTAVKVCLLHRLIAPNAHLSAIYSAPHAFICLQHSVAVTKRWLGVRSLMLMYAVPCSRAARYTTSRTDCQCPVIAMGVVNGRLWFRRRRHLVISVINVTCQPAHLWTLLLIPRFQCP